MPQTETLVSQLKINRLTKARFKSASDLSETELYAVDPQFTGGKLLKTDSNGDIVESTATEENILAGATAIQGVQVNGSDLTPDANKKVNVQVPTNTNQLTNGAGFITAGDVEANIKDITPSNRIVNIDLSDTTQFSKESQTYGWTYNSTYGLCPENSKTIRGSGVANSFAYCKWSINYDTPVKITIEFTQDSQQSYDYLAMGCYDYEVSKSYSVGTYQYRTYNKLGSFSVELYVPAGEHYLTWKYIKNSSTDTGLDMCYITSIKVEKLVQIKFKNVDTNEERIIDLLKQPIYATYNVTPYITINTALKNNIPVYYIYSGRIYQATSYPTATSATTSIYCTSAYSTSSTSAIIYYMSIANTNAYATGSFTALPSSRIVNNMTASTSNAPTVTAVINYVDEQVNQAMEDSY